MGDKSVGTYARLSIIDAEGKELEKHYARDFKPANPMMKRPGDEAWVKATWGEKFGVKVEALRGETYVYKIYCDGTLMRSFYMSGGQSILKEVCTRTIGEGATARQVFQPLMFAQPELKGGGGGDEDERPLAQQMAGAGMDKLGRVTLEVWDAIRTTPQVVTGTVASSRSMDGPKMNEKSLIKKGAFASTTKFGAEERVAMVSSGGVSCFMCGYNCLEKLELRYGHVSQLLILGCPVERFRVQQAPREIETVELDDDDEEEKASRKRVKKEKKEEEGGGAKRVKTEPGTGGGAAASSSSAAAAAGGGGGGGGDGGGGGGDDDGVWDLT